MTDKCKTSELLPNPYNRELDRNKIDHIKAEIQRTGEVYPLVYSEVDNEGKPAKMLTDGHHRFAALKELGHDEVPVVLSDERGLKTKAPKEEVEKLAKGLAKAWFGDPEGHAEAARHDGARNPEDVNNGIKTAVKVAATAAIVAGGVLALRNPAFRSAIASRIKSVLPKGKAAVSEAKFSFPKAAAKEVSTGITAVAEAPLKTAAGRKALAEEATDQFGAIKDFDAKYNHNVLWNPVFRDTGLSHAAIKEVVTHGADADRHMGVRMLYNPRNGNFVMGPWHVEHEEIFNQAVAHGQIPKNAVLDKQWSRLRYDVGKKGAMPQFDTEDSLHLHSWDNSDENPGGSFLATMKSILNHKDEFPDSLKAEFFDSGRHYGGMQTLGEWRAAAKKGLLSNDIAKSMAKAWFGDPERHAEAARHDGISTAADSKTSTHDGLKTAIKVAAIGALAVGGVAALRSSAGRNLIASATKTFMERFPASSVGRSAYAATLANGGHTVSMAGEVPVARYMFSPFKAQEKIIPIKNFSARSVDRYVAQNKATLAQQGNHLGTWHNKETGNVHLDISVPHSNRYQALLAAEKHKQLAIYDSVAGKDIPVNASTIGQAKFVESVRERYEYAPHSWKPALADEGFGLDVLQEIGGATARGPSRSSVSIVYNRTNGYFGVGDINREHSDIFGNLQNFYGAKVQGDLDTRWARMTYAPAHGATGGSGKLNLWNWSTEFEEARGTSSKNYADTLESVIRNKNFPDDLIFGVKTPFRQQSEERTLGEWRELYGKSKKGILSEGIDAFMKNIDEIKKLEDDSKVPNRTAMAAEEQAEHPTLPATVIDQIVQDHLKVGKDVLYKRGIEIAKAILAKSYKTISDKKKTVIKPVVMEPTVVKAFPKKDAKDTEKLPVKEEEQPKADTEVVAEEKSAQVKENAEEAPTPSKVNREVPTEASAQPNTQESIAQVQSIDETLIALHSALVELEALANDQQMLSDDEMQIIILPLQEKVSLLLNALKGGRLEESATETQNPEEVAPEDSTEETTDEEEPAEDGEPEEVSPDTKEPSKDSKDPEDPQRKRKKPQGPPRKPGTGTAERELTEPATDFTGKVTSNSDLHKGFFGMGGGQRGWRGDPEGHAEAARERWAAQGVPPGGAQKPVSTRRAGQQPVVPPTAGQRVSEAALILPKAVKDVALKTAGRAGRSLARAAGDTIAEIGWQAFGTVAGLVLYRYLAGKSLNPAKLGALGVQSLKRTLAETLKMSRVASTVKALKMEQTLRNFISTGAGAAKVIAGAGKVAASAAKTSAKVSRATRATARAIEIARKLKPKA